MLATVISGRYCLLPSLQATYYRKHVLVLLLVNTWRNSVHNFASLTMDNLIELRSKICKTIPGTIYLRREYCRLLSLQALYRHLLQKQFIGVTS